MSKPRPEKKKMATSREVYDRIIWDARLDRNAFVCGYVERRASNGIREKPLVAWEAEGDIPWHRIRYIRCQETVVWDREQHLDLVSIGQLPAAAWVTPGEESALVVTLPSVQKPEVVSAFSARPVYKYDLQSWQPVSLSAESAILDTLTIASFNVLCDMYEQERIQTAKRIPAILESLRNCNADIVAIQEATPPLLEALLAQDWVRELFISESPGGATLQPYGLLLLSRLPLTLVEHQYSAHKRVLVGTWQINGQLLRVAVVHLPSNRAHNANEVRAHQLRVLLDYLKTQPGNCLIVGDFNIRGDELGEAFTQSNFIDVWKVLHPLEEGYTFDPTGNTLAALMSLAGEAARFDRVLLRDEDKGWTPHSMELFACEPISGTDGTLYPSDHFGVCAVLQASLQKKAFLQTVQPVYQSAVVVIPSAEVWPAIQAIRRRYDRRIDRWMPHITLLYGFVPEEYFEEATQLIAPALAEIKPFEVTLLGVETFEHRSSSTAWLQPVTQPPGALHQLQAVLYQLFPQCDEQSTKSPMGFTPHLSVGQFSRVEDAQTQLINWHPVSFSVESVALISRRGDQPFEVRYWVQLGQGDKGAEEERIRASSFDLMQLINNLEPQLSWAQQVHRETVLAVVAQACTECLGSEASLHLLGSARLGVQSPQSDLDVLCLIPGYISGETFLENVQLKLAGLYERAQVVKDARIPVLRMRLEGVSVDLLYAHYPAELGQIKPLTEATQQHFDPISWRAWVGCLEADTLTDVLVSVESFRGLLRAVRAWAKARQLHGNAWGFLGNFSWALLAAWTCASDQPFVTDTTNWQEYPNPKSAIQNPKFHEALLAHFFQALVQHDWSQPVALTPVGQQYPVRVPRDWLPVVTSIEPCQNSARNVSRSTAQLLRHEFSRAAELIEQVKTGEFSWEALFASADLMEQSEQFLVLTATSEDNNGLEICCGWLEGHIIGLVIELERLGADVRPWPKIRREANKGYVVLGLELPEDFNHDALQQLSQDFVLRFNTGNVSPNCTLESVLGDRQMLTQLRLNL